MINVLMNKTSFMECDDDCSHEQNKTSFMERDDECSHEQNKFYGT